MTEPDELSLSGTWAAARLVAALWFGLLSFWTLRRSQRMPGWEILLALATLIASTYVWQAVGTSSAWRTSWLIHSAVAAIMLIESLRGWVTQAEPAGPSAAKAKRTRPLLAITIALVGLGLSQSITIYSAWQLVTPGWLVRACVAGQMITSTLLCGSLLASTLELTVGALGTELLQRAWGRLMAWGSLGMLMQVLLGLTVMAKLKPAETAPQAAAPVLFAFGMAILAYIASCVPRRMAYLAGKQTIEGQASLALSGWIGLICLALAMALPATWPWNALSL